MSDSSTALVDNLNAQVVAVMHDIETNFLNDGSEAIGDMALSILNAESFEDMFGNAGAEDADDWRNKEFQLDRVSYQKSDMGNEGLPYYAVLHVTDVSDGSKHVITCGAWQVVIVTYQMVKQGWLPRLMTFKKSERPTRQGYYPVNIWPVGKGEVEEPF